MTEGRIQSAMTIILHAGDARNACMSALNALAEDDFETAEINLTIAQQEITKAHKAQTDEIQEEAAGEKESEYSLLFTHAQDTLMTVMSEINIAKSLLKICRNVDNKINSLKG